MAVTGYKFTALIGGGAGAIDSQDGAGLQDGDIAIVINSGYFYPYQLDADSGAAESSPDIISPDANAGDKRWILQRSPQTNSIPVGSIVPFIGGYFANSANGGFVNVLGNDAASVNSLVNSDGWYVCDGAEVNVSGSPIFDGSGRHIANITDSRFIMGNASAGSVGGTNNANHQHPVNIGAFTSGATTLTLDQIPNHNHPMVVDLDHYTVTTATSGTPHARTSGGGPTEDIYLRSSGGGGSHTHSVDPPNTSTGSATELENRPRFLTAIYIQKVI